MNSFIDLFIYEVKGPTDLSYPSDNFNEKLNHLLSFKKLVKKKKKK